jgi:hypothetical protein
MRCDYVIAEPDVTANAAKKGRCDQCPSVLK